MERFFHWIGNTNGRDYGLRLIAEVKRLEHENEALKHRLAAVATEVQHAQERIKAGVFPIHWDNITELTKVQDIS